MRFVARVSWRAQLNKRRPRPWVRPPLYWAMPRPCCLPLKGAGIWRVRADLPCQPREWRAPWVCGGSGSLRAFACRRHSSARIRDVCVPGSRASLHPSARRSFACGKRAPGRHVGLPGLPAALRIRGWPGRPSSDAGPALIRRVLALYYWTSSDADGSAHATLARHCPSRRDRSARRRAGGSGR